MDIADLLSADRVLLDVDVSCSKQAFRVVADVAAATVGLDKRAVMDALQERERLGTTGVGDGISIPHARFEGLGKACGFFVRLRSSIDMDALDNKSVDLMFVLLAPQDANADHLKALSRIARVMRSPDNQRVLRQNGDKNVILAVLTSEDT